MPPATLLIYFLTFLSGRRKQPHLANQRHVPAICGGQRPGAAPGRQEAQIQHQDQEQQLVTKVQRNIPIVSSLVSYVLDTQAHSTYARTHTQYSPAYTTKTVGSILHSVDYLYTTKESRSTLYKVQHNTHSASVSQPFHFSEAVNKKRFCSCISCRCTESVEKQQATATAIHKAVPLA